MTLRWQITTGFGVPLAFAVIGRFGGAVDAASNLTIEGEVELPLSHRDPVSLHGAAINGSSSPLVVRRVDRLGVARADR